MKVKKNDRNEAIRRNLVEGVSKVHLILLHSERERDNDVLMWDISPDGAFIMHVIISHRDDLFYSFIPFFPLNTAEAKQDTNDQWRTKKRRLNSLTRWRGRCVVGTFPGTFGCCPCRCGCHIRWWERFLTWVETAPSEQTCRQNRWALLRNVLMLLIWISWELIEQKSCCLNTTMNSIYSLPH